jgi:putative addiction module component (TIGR02574 family)
MITKSDIEQLTAEEKIFLVEEIWDSLARVPSKVPTSAEEIATLNERIAEHERNPEAALSLEEFKRRRAERT